MQRRRPRSRRDREESSVEDLLAGIQEALLHVLECQACPQCGGTGMASEGAGPDGRPRFTRCPCRFKAAAFVEEFQ